MNMKTIEKIVQIQIDEKPTGYVIRINDENGCFLRVCQIPKEVIDSNFIDVIYPKTQKK